ncbi:hypothetical protein C8R43DRAFT_1105536 [Mycena crocata]|nr:hypothetical protein C8R43DRAFT_1105536 [Mycena crocata]
MSVSRDPALKFIIVGASIAGLTSAIALKAAGHTVLVLEKEPQLGGPESLPSGGARIPPNGCKVLFDWGLETEIRENAVVGEGFMIYTYEGTGPSRDYIGLNLWHPELLIDARGDFLQMRHKDLLHILSNAARHSKGPSSEVTLLFDAEVIEIDGDTCSVTLHSGETHHGDVIIGADGASGLVRKYLIREESKKDGMDGVPSGLSVYSAVIPKELAVEDEELASLYEYPQRNMVTLLMGNNRGAKVFLAGKEQDVLLWLYTPDNSHDGSWNREAETDICKVVGLCDPLIQKLAAHAGPSTCIQIKDRYELDSWVSKSGNILVIGEAAHPFPPISLHNGSIAIEDGAFLGRIFSHTRNPDRIREFLYAFEETRKPRCAYILQSENRNVNFITLPHGESQAARDASMRANHAAGRNVMDAPEADMQHIWDDMRTVFGYDPRDAADEWWVSWGRYGRQEEDLEEINLVHEKKGSDDSSKFRYGYCYVMETACSLMGPWWSIPTKVSNSSIVPTLSILLLVLVPKVELPLYEDFPNPQARTSRYQ